MHMHDSTIRRLQYRPKRVRISGGFAPYCQRRFVFDSATGLDNPDSVSLTFRTPIQRIIL